MISFDQDADCFRPKNRVKVVHEVDIVKTLEVYLFLINKYLLFHFKKIQLLVEWKFVLINYSNNYKKKIDYNNISFWNFKFYYK